MTNHKADLALRIVLGLMLVSFGLNYFFGFFAPPEPTAGKALLKALKESGYVMEVISAIFIVGGVLFFMNRAVPFALVLIAPILFNILAFHLQKDPGNFLAGLILSILAGALAWSRRGAFASLFTSRAPSRS